MRKDLVREGEIMDEPDTYLAILAALSYSDREMLSPTEVAEMTDYTQGGFYSISNRVPRNDPPILDARTNPVAFVLTEAGEGVVDQLQEEHDLHHSYISEVDENGQQDLDDQGETSTSDEPDEPDGDTDGDETSRFEFTCSICDFGSDKEKNVRRHVTLKEDEAHQGVSGDVVDIVDRNEDGEDGEESAGADSDETDQVAGSIDRLDSVLGEGSDDDRDDDQEESGDRGDRPDPSRSAAYQTVMERPSLEWDNGDLDLDELGELDDEGDPLVGALIAVTLDVADHARQDKSSSHQRAEIRAKELGSMAEAVKAIADVRRKRREGD